MVAEAAPASRVKTTRSGQPLLEVKDLRTQFMTQDGVVKAVDGVSFYVMPGETLGVVGESGSGKSMTGLSIMRLIPMPPGKIASGEVLLEGRDIIKMSDNDVRKIRGKEIAMIFQDPMTSLNPVLTISRQLCEAIQLHLGMNREQARARAVDLLKMVGIPNAAKRLDQDPHQFSDGMRQRVMIAMALSCNPKLIIADEPTTALDVTIQAQILDLLKNLKERCGMAIMLITHAMGVVAETAQRVVVMYAGKVIEEAPDEALFANPRHPYTQGLIRSIPRIEIAATRKARLEAIPGVVPSLINPPP